MAAQAPPLLPAARPSLRERVLLPLVVAAMRASLLVSPRPAALLIRRVFATGGAQTKAILDRHAPSGLTVLRDERYGAEPDALMDVVHPDGMTGPLPLVFWVHGGGWVGGSKAELTGYLKLLASDGYVVAGADYSRAPEHRYPMPLRQLTQALAYLVGNAERYHIDPERIAIAGDSAGAQLAAQLAAAVTTPGYAAAIGLTPTITKAQLRALMLCCGPYDVGLAASAGSPAGRQLIRAVLWAYTGRRRFLTDPDSTTWSVTDNLGPDFPPTLITVGNADTLRSHSELLCQRLDALGVPAEAFFFPVDHQPPLGHEYQFNLDLAEARQFLDRVRGFLRRHLSV